MANATKSHDYYIGVDVGTGSARAALVGCDGEIVAESTYTTTTYRDDHNHDIFEQSTTEIWNSIAKACKDCLRDGEPMSITENEWGSGESKRNIILWADHRAREEANLINSSGSPVLQYVGGTMSLEMEFLKATGNLARSNCSLACRIRFQTSWRVSRQIRINPDSRTTSGSGLTEKAANELGLLPNTPVGSGVIDAYAGWIGVVAAKMEGEKDSDLGTSQHRLCVSAGTSSCHIVQSPIQSSCPEFGVLTCTLSSLDVYWMNEGGQSSTGQLLDFIIDTHPAVEKVKALAQAKGVNHFVFLNDTLKQAQQDKKAPFLTYLTKDYYLYPDLHGNRSPLADNAMKGMLIAIALQTRQIVDKMNEKGHKITSIFMSGGLVGMSRPGTTIKPDLTEKEKKLLEVKYKIFNECIDLQRKWRKDVEDALN
ncbi:hypothetical protein H4Q26_005519 [Puccinia striiformis f. sp. tritici PST-130]|nr:hypothetical protein H4Q26_005519 [Puccinia striiformis f. sp. tritici PST-130]